MKIYKRIVIDMATLAVTHTEEIEYAGPVAFCCGGGGGGGAPGTGDPSDVGLGMSTDLGGDIGQTSDFGGGGQMGGLTGSDGSAVAPQISFSKTGLEIGTIIGGLLGPGGAVVGGIVGGVVDSAISGSGVPGGTDMSGDPTGGNAVGGPDTPDTTESETPKPTEEDEPGELEEAPKEDKDEDKIIKKPETILTSPLGLKDKATTKKKTLLGG